MQNLTPAGQNLVRDIAHRYQLSEEAVLHILIAVNNGGGSMAQFNCPELGGSGQWMRGGMTMAGDMFNHGLQATVNNLCNELSNALSQLQVFPVIESKGGQNLSWWPQELGMPLSSGNQNNTRYAIFPGRLAVEVSGQITIYDTLDHQISGISQQQGSETTLVFSSQYGNLQVSSLPILSGPGLNQEPDINFAKSNEDSTTEVTSTQRSSVESVAPMNEEQSSPKTSSDEVLELISKLAKLRDAEALTEEEFNQKKTELLERL